MTDVVHVDRSLAFTGRVGKLAGRRWSGENPRYIALLCHGYGEHSGRYEWVAQQLVADGAAVFALDHMGHGESEGERVLITSFDDVVSDFMLLEWTARAEYPQLPVVLIGHSMGGMIAICHAMRNRDDIDVLVVSGPLLGAWAAGPALLAEDPIPDVPIDPATLSRDPSVGEAYVNDPLVWHGPFKRPTLQAMVSTMDALHSNQPLGIPALHLHGGDDQLIPVDPVIEEWARLGGRRSQEKIYPGARHEIFNETNKDEVIGDMINFITESLPVRADPGPHTPR